MKSRFLCGFASLAALWAVSGISAGCSTGGTSPIEPQEELSVSIRTPSSDNAKGYSWVSVTADGDWTLSFEEAVSWAQLSATSGTGNKSNISLSWEQNSSSEQRSLTLVLSCKGRTRKDSFTQSGTEKPSPDIIKSDPLTNWMELPAMGSGLYFITHPMEMDGKKLRNYSYAWDTENLVARWVAYPLNSRLKSGSCGRSDAWGLDPKLPRGLQPVLLSAYGGFGQRGHQIPSADRQILKYNMQTFYGTNMTPQDGTLNTGVWANLEMYVRDRSASFDTLYVVTGCTVEGSPGKAYDNEGKPVTIPSGYYKALLGLSSGFTIGNSASQGGYTGIAFYMPNRSISGNYMDYSMTISELEAKVGVDFFVNLPAAIGSSNANKVQTSKDSWWEKNVKK